MNMEVGSQVLNGRAIQIIYIIPIEWTLLFVSMDNRYQMFCSTKYDWTDKDSKIMAIFICYFIYSSLDVEFWSEKVVL